MRGPLRSVPHATEIPYLFGTVAAHCGEALKEADQVAAQAAHRHWINFTKTGASNSAALPE